MSEQLDSKKSLRILIVTHAPLSKELGAGQVAINLADAFRMHGHSVRLWSPHPILTGKFNILPSLQNITGAREKIDRFLDGEDTFDIIDAPSVFISKRVLKYGTVVVSRSVQPQILYMIHDLMKIKNLRNLFRKPFDFLDICVHLFYLIQGYQRSSSIFCLGSLELKWTKKKLPWFNKKVNCYLNALAADEQNSLKKIRENRNHVTPSSVKFLWIGRWSSHKGTTDLVTFIVERAKAKPDDSFTIAGCGSDVQKYIPGKLIESGQVKIISKFDRKDLFFLLSDHDIGLFTSKLEGWGLVLNEMLESGMPVYASNAGGVPDLQDYFSGIIRPFPPPLNISLQNPDNCNWDKYYEQFSWNNIAKRYLSKVLIKK